MKPVERQIEADDGVFAEPFDQCQRLVDWPPPDLVQRDRAIFLGILQQDSHTVQAARFGVKVKFFQGHRRIVV